MKSRVLKKVILAGLVLLPLCLLVIPGNFERRENRRQVIDSRVRLQTFAGHTVPRLRHAVVRLRRALRRRLHKAIHWLRVVRRAGAREAALRRPGQSFNQAELFRRENP